MERGFKQAFYIDGRYLSGIDHLFASKLNKDVIIFLKDSHRTSFLIFPPFTPKYRYLSHRIIDNIYSPTLFSFSVGTNDQRRIIIGFTHSISRICFPSDDVFSLNNFAQYQIKMSNSLVNCSDHQNFSFSEKSSLLGLQDLKLTNGTTKIEKLKPQKEKSKRPDKALYIPRALRVRYESSEISTKEDKSSLHSFTNNECTKFNENKILIKLKENEDSSYKIQNKCNKHKMKEIHNIFEKKTSPQKLKNKIEIKGCNENIPFKVENQILSNREKSSNSELNVPESCTMNLENKLNNERNDYKHEDENAVNNVNKINERQINGMKIMICQNNEVNNLSNLCINSNTKEDFDNYLENNKKDAIQDYVVNKEDIPICSVVNQEFKDIKSSKLYTSNNTISEDSTWDELFDEDGECLNPDLKKEIKALIGDRVLQKAEGNYSDYQTFVKFDSQEYNHIVEIYDFPVEFKTENLMAALSIFKDDCYSIKWVDDTHALGIFSSIALANQALMLNHPFVKVRPISEGIKESQLKAKYAKFVPYKPRPATCVTFAHRLVSGALGLKVKSTKTQIENDKRLLKEAQEQKKLKAKQKQDIWNGIT